MDKKNYKKYLGNGFYQHDKNTVGFGKPNDWSDTSSNSGDEFMIKNLQKKMSTLLPTDSSLQSACPARIKPTKKKIKKRYKHKNNVKTIGNIELEPNVDEKCKLEKMSSVIDDLEQDERILSELYQKRISILNELGIGNSKKNLSEISSSDDEVNDERKEVSAAEVLKDDPSETDEEAAVNEMILKKIGDNFWADKIKNDTDDHTDHDDTE
ncbi:hypothetical protein O3M35_009321 [Rhynocoris fuscipes]|uniref:Uncharacterized protein n=1 Tax=Rhynocoris fuscipes TaxID=488301 RepID=A0AAW1D9G8_9HEMI